MHFTILPWTYSKDLEIDRLQSLWDYWWQKIAVTLLNKNIVLLWASAIRICHPLEVILSRSLKKSWLWGAGWWLHEVLMRLPFCLVLLHVSVSLWPSELKPRNPSGTRSVWHCHYWTTYKCCGLQDWQQKEIVFLFLISERQRGCAHIYWKWDDPWKNGWPINQIW